MDWHQIEENWKQAKRKIKEKWEKLTDGDLVAIEGRRSRLEDRIHKRYGFATDHVRKEIDDWLRWQIPKSRHAGPGAKRTEIDTVAGWASRGEWFRIVPITDGKTSLADQPPGSTWTE